MRRCLHAHGSGIGLSGDQGAGSIDRVDLVAQWVRVCWTKQSRGGHHAGRRNAAPSAFALPQIHARHTHEVTMHERDGFQPHA